MVWSSLHIAGTLLFTNILENGLIQTTTDPCLYRSLGGEAVYQGVYVDDIVAAEVKNKFGSQFDIKDLHGKLHP